ncbi:MAG TPA: hypothetical protein VFW96_00375 [Thermomicrobiales bacterium]|nr:hypothetical protein [Thermomicrobiales bacterium]
MSERARILSWWVYVLAVVAIFEVTFLSTNFAYAVGAALASIVVLGLLLKALIRGLTRGQRR